MYKKVVLMTKEMIEELKFKYVAMLETLKVIYDNTEDKELKVLIINHIEKMNDILEKYVGVC